MTTEERLAALEKSVAELQDPQRIRDSLEYTWNPRGTADEVRVQDAAGALLPIRKRIQFLGGITDDPANSRSIVPAPTGGGNLPSLVWSDDFSTDQLATAYKTVTGQNMNYTVSGGKLNHGSTTSWAGLSNSSLHARNMIVQAITQTATNVSNTDSTYTQVEARIDSADDTAIYAYARLIFKDAASGHIALKVGVSKGDGTNETTASQAVNYSLSATPLWVRLYLSEGYVYGAYFRTDPAVSGVGVLELSCGVDVRNWTTAYDGTPIPTLPHLLASRPGVSSKITSGSVTGLTIDDFKVWHT